MFTFKGQDLKKLVATTRKLGDYPNAPKWLRKQSKITLKQFKEYSWYLYDWAVISIEEFRNKLSQEEFLACMENSPYWALKYCDDLIPTDRFDRYAARYPAASLKFCLDRLSDEQFDKFIRNEVSTSTSNKKCIERMTDEQFEWCTKKRHILQDEANLAAYRAGKDEGQKLKIKKAKRSK